MKEILYIIVLSLGSISVLFILTKLMGYRQMSQLSMFDYINGITIGSIAAEMATSLDQSFIQPLVAMLVYAGMSILLSWLSSKSITAKRFIEGKPIILFNNGELYKKNLKKAKIDVNEFLSQCRVNGFFDISKLQTAIMEENGHISFLEKSEYRPIVPHDVKIKPVQDYMVANVIIDGKVIYKNLQHTGNNIRWLNNHIKAQGANCIEDVLLATCDKENNITIYLKKIDRYSKDIFV
ncbi:MAG: DUF421 domain-containing protein [Lachnospiraceae bacterium]|nr:DUF421 domain-containing protein [Lachnospiraceae bacterium]